MNLNSLRPAFGSTKSDKRIGRGVGSGKGGTSTRGHKGAKSRSGFKNKRHFEGGQMPLQMRLPKRGFKNVNRVAYAPINVERLQDIHDKFGVSEFNETVLRDLGIIGGSDLVKILGDGDVSSPIKLSFSKISDSAKQKIEAAGGSITIA